MIYKSALEGAGMFTKFKIFLIDGHSFVSEQPDATTLAEFVSKNWSGMNAWCVFHKVRINVPASAITRVQGIE